MLLPLLISTAFAVTPDAPSSVLNREGATLRTRFSAELGALVPLKHTIQFDKDGTVFDYVEEGGQSNLFPFTRFQADLDIGDRHTVVLLYQPLDLASTSVIKRDVSVADVTFPEGTPMAYRYGFSFVRGSWMYDLAEGPRKEAALGVSLQVRNATIDFRSLDGELYTSQRDIGPVPVLKFRGRLPVAEDAWVGAEVDGFYAPIKYLNGGDVDVVGAIVDGSLRAGIAQKNGVDLFLNLRTIAGGAEGTSDETDSYGDGFTNNWLVFSALSIGTTLR